MTTDTRSGVLARLRPGPNQSWLELFYDLTFVASLVVLSNSYSNDKSITHALWLAIVGSLIWVAWVETTLLTNRHTLQRFWPRALYVLQMLLVLLLAIAADDTVGNNTEYVGPIFALVTATLIPLYLLAAKERPELLDFARHHAVRSGIAGVIFVLSPFYGDVWYWIPWVVAVAIIIAPDRGMKFDQALDRHHLVHRFGEFTIIVLGEAFLKIALIATEEPLDQVDLLGLPLTFGVIYAIWWMYFTDVTPAGLPESPGRIRVWIATHLPLQLSITSLAVGMSLILNPSIDAVEPAYIRMILTPLLVISLALAAINLTQRTDLGRRRARVHGLAALAFAIAFTVLQLTEGFDEEITAGVAIVVLSATALSIRRIDVPEDESITAERLPELD